MLFTKTPFSNTQDFDRVFQQPQQRLFFSPNQFVGQFGFK
jgi:hypothetical protein